MTNIATRLLSMILLLQSRSIWKAAELAAELNISERTVHRYMTMLEEMGIPLYTERGPYGGFSLLRGYKLPPLIFTAEEATVLYMGAQLVKEVWGQTYEGAVTAATAKLDNVLPDDLRQEVASARQSLVISGMTRLNYGPWERTIHVLRRCIGDRRQVTIGYHSFARPQEIERMVDPYALAFQWGLWYLVGYCHLREALRTFRVDRIHQAVMLETRFTPPRDFDVRRYLAENVRAEPAHSAIVQIDAHLAPEVRQRHGHWMDMTDQADGSLVARFGVATLDWTVGWVLSCGSSAQALHPPELVRRVRTAAEGIVARYLRPSLQDTEDGPADMTSNQASSPR
jgi:predicted DNA-binding transcriptional regulator YafY